MTSLSYFVPDSENASVASVQRRKQWIRRIPDTMSSRVTASGNKTQTVLKINIEIRWKVRWGVIGMTVACHKNVTCLFSAPESFLLYPSPSVSTPKIRPYYWYFKNASLEACLCIKDWTVSRVIIFITACFFKIIFIYCYHCLSDMLIIGE